MKTKIFFKIAIIGLFTLLSINSNAQAYHPLVEENKYWDVLQDATYGSITPCGLEGGARYFLRGDTIINSKTYKKIYVQGFIGEPSAYPYFCTPYLVDTNSSFINKFIREDTLTQKVYLYDEYLNNYYPECSIDGERVLYDFNVQAGDTLKCYVATMGDCSYESIVDSVQYEYGSKVVYFHGYGFGLGYYKLIEGIGGSGQGGGLFQPILQPEYGGFWLECAFIDDSLYAGGCADYITNNAQTYYPLVETNKIWSVGEVTGVWGPYLEHGSSYLYWFNNDTMIDGKNYYMIYRTHDTTLTTYNINGYIREDATKKVYFKQSINEQEHLLYDFGLNINDTLNYIYSDSLWSDTCKLVLNYIDSIFVGNKYKKQYHFNPINADSDDIWIEGVGSLKGILYPERCYVGLYSELLCFSENDTLKYINTTYNTCYIDPVGINKKNNQNIKLSYYNNSIEIQLSEYDEPYLFKLYNIMGNVVISISSNQSIKILLDNYNIKQGMYLYTLSTNKDVINRNKIIYIKY